MDISDANVEKAIRFALEVRRKKSMKDEAGESKEIILVKRPAEITQAIML